MMFFWKKNKKGDSKLSDIVKKVNDTGYVFIDINNDLGEAAEEILSSTPMVQMAYGYARRTAVAALYIQGLVDKQTYDHVISIFKSLQIETGHTVEFQESAFADAAEFMLEYHHLINTFMVKMIVHVVENYDVPSGQITDPQLFEVVLETAHNEQANTPAMLGRQHAKSICSEVKDFELIYQLVLEDIEGASMGNDAAKKFARTSGITPDQYRGALNNSRPEIDASKGIKSYLDEMAMQFYPNSEKMAEYRLAATDYLMSHYGIGKYSKKEKDFSTFFDEDIPF